MSNETILAIDDQDDNLALLEAMLLPRGYTFYGARSGPVGLELARTIKPDLLLLDIAMPGMDGFAVLAELRKEPSFHTLPVIVLTANFREASSVERGLALGASEYLTKPIQTDELLVRIRAAIRLAMAERELSKMRRDFASMLVHDMRAPLDGVRLVLGTLKRDEPAGSSRAELLDLALDSLLEVGTMIDNLLDVNRLEEEGFAAHIENIPLGTVVNAAVKTMRPVADARAIHLVSTLEPEALVVAADARLLRRVLENLLANALKFTEAGAVTVAAYQAGAEVVLEVRDTGAGIPAESLSRIFERYYTGENSYGLGLAFCARAIAAQGASISAISAVGQGSTFTIRLPVPATPNV